jgi:preprotein translocase subunit Sec61beta
MKPTIGTLEQDLWMASPSQATSKTEIKTVKVLGVPIAVAGLTTWKTGTESKMITPSTAVGAALAVMLVIASIMLLIALMLV